MFDEAWPYVDLVYTKLQSELLQAHGTLRVQGYQCKALEKQKMSNVVLGGSCMRLLVLFGLRIK